MRYIFAILLIFGVSSLAEARRDISELVEVRKHLDDAIWLGVKDLVLDTCSNYDEDVLCVNKARSCIRQWRAPKLFGNYFLGCMNQKFSTDFSKITVCEYNGRAYCYDE